jgi:hypothetical protein
MKQLAYHSRDEEIDLLLDQDAFDADVVQAASVEFEAINAICDCIADLLCDPADLARR